VRRGGQTGGVAGFAHPRGFAPLWVYFFGWFAVAVAQVWLLPPDEHSVLFNVTVFAVAAVIVGIALTVAERRTRARR
jgi:hypothetical protein